jgi:DNA processing protein
LPDAIPAEVIFAAVRTAIQQLLSAPMKDADVAAALDVSNAQAKAWLRRLVDERLLVKQKNPAGYVVKQTQLFE